MAKDESLLSEVWRWLPVFRAVAEVENVSKAARNLGLSAAATSRALAKVEAAVERELFDRRGRQLSLNPHGAELLDAVRRATKLLDDAVGQLNAHAPRGLVRVGSVGQLAGLFLLPAVRALAESHPEIELSISHLEPEEALRRLSDGSLDWFLALNVSVGSPFEAAALGELQLALYAGRRHPLFPQVQPSLTEILRHGFVAQRRPALMRSVWPKEHKRRVSLQTDAHAVSLEACLSGSHLMVMERLIAAPHVARGELREYPAPFLEPVQLVLLRNGERPSRSAETAVGAAIEAAARAVLNPRRRSVDDGGSRARPRASPRSSAGGRRRSA